MTQEQARLVFIMAVNGLKEYERGRELGLHMGLWRDDKVAALKALSAEYGARFPDAEKDGYFTIPPRLIA